MYDTITLDSDSSGNMSILHRGGMGGRGGYGMSDFSCSHHCSPIVLKFNGIITSKEKMNGKIYFDLLCEKSVT